MKSIESKEAHHLALTNAAAMLQTHGEEGGIYQEDYHVDVDIYLRERTKVANMLYKMADNYKKKHKLFTNQ